MRSIKHGLHHGIRRWSTGNFSSFYISIFRENCAYKLLWIFFDNKCLMIAKVATVEDIQYFSNKNMQNKYSAEHFINWYVHKFILKTVLW